MTSSNPIAFQPREIVRTLRKHLWLWIVPTVACTILAAVYAIMTPPTWEADQALLLRGEYAGGAKRQGRFDNLDAMKTAQETILEIVRSPAVLTAALERIGPPAGYADPSHWPTQRDIEKCRKRITLKPPKGAEFGTTEVLYLSVEASTKDRAVQLANAVYDQLDQRVRKLRNTKAQTLIEELDKMVILSQADLEAATQPLQEIEAKVGSDLAELRNLDESAGGSSSLQDARVTIENELRQVRAKLRADKQLQRQLETARKDPDQFVAMPNSLLVSQPALRRLKEGLVDAQLRTARLLGKMTPEHPEVLAATDGQQQVRHRLHRELDVAIRGLSADVAVSQDRVSELGRQLHRLESRLDRLAELRARYHNSVEEVERRSEILKAAQKSLADGRATLAAAETTSLITRIDKPQTSDQPNGPGDTILVASGGVGGLALGLGLVFLVAPLGRQWGRRRSDRISGRRQSHRTEPGRREEDQSAEQEAFPHARPTAGAPRRASDFDRSGPSTDPRPAVPRATSTPSTRRSTDVGELLARIESRRK